MLCQSCSQAEATIHVSVREPDKPDVDSDYCHACHQLQVTNWPPADPPPFPLSRFTIKGLMIVAGLFAILNAAVVLVLKRDPFPATAARIPDLTIRALLVGNLGFAVFLSDCLAMSWLEKLARYRKRGKATLMLGRSNRNSIEYVDVWSHASPRERVFLTLLHLYSVTCTFGFLVQAFDPNSWISGRNLGLLLAFLLLVFSVWVLLLWGLAASTQRQLP
jgi:hypothetical protein